MYRPILNIRIICTVILVCGSCDLLEYSPYDTDVATECINISNIARINGNTNSSDTLKFALISDPHISYDELNESIKEIGKHEDLQFIVCCGDVTNSGLNREFKCYSEIIKDSKYPVITVIGNHDYRSNGLEIYKRLFGLPNMSFMCMGYNFIMFDDVVWENNNQSPRFDWLEEELERCDLPCVLLTHIPPCSDQLEGIYCLTFTRLISESNLILCLHGHNHHFSEKPVGGVPTIESDNIGDREYCIVELFDHNFKIVRINF